jgi:hypothetical protein
LLDKPNLQSIKYVFIPQFFESLTQMASRRLLLSTRHRITVVESLYVDHLHTSTRFLIGLPDDREIVLDYASQISDPLILALGIIFIGNYQFKFEEHVGEWLNQLFTILVTDCFEVVGIIAGRVVKNEVKNSPISSEDSCDKYFQIDLIDIHSDYQW